MVGRTGSAMLNAQRVSRYIYVFHDSDSAPAASWAADREILTSNGFDVSVIRESPAFVEALVAGEIGRCMMEWARDSFIRSTWQPTKFWR